MTNSLNRRLVAPRAVSCAMQSGQRPSVATYVPAFVAWINQQIDGTGPSSPIHFGWELPQSTADGVATGLANVQGWAFSNAGAITSVRLERDGTTLINAPCCSERGDVQRTVPGAPLQTGFAAVINWGNLGDQLNNLTLVVRDSAGNELRDRAPSRAFRFSAA